LDFPHETNTFITILTILNRKVKKTRSSSCCFLYLLSYHEIKTFYVSYVYKINVVSKVSSSGKVKFLKNTKRLFYIQRQISVPISLLYIIRKFTLKYWNHFLKKLMLCLFVWSLMPIVRYFIYFPIYPIRTSAAFW
jgi:hypothetical protein